MEDEVAAAVEAEGGGSLGSSSSDLAPNGSFEAVALSR